MLDTHKYLRKIKSATVGEFVDVKVTSVKKSVLGGEIVSDTSLFVEKELG